MSERHPRKRAAFEPVAAPVARNPAMRRPAATVAGGVLVLLRAASGILWGLTVVFPLPSWMQTVAGAADGSGADPTFTLSDLGLDGAVFFGILGVITLVQAVFGILLLRGSNVARVIVMLVSTLSIITAFAGWWELGQEITVGTTLVTVSLDILVLLALSSRDAAAYARRNEKV
ncbi:MAG: hypothetical protein BGO45_16395 [Microbacterium sp. 71-36]|uniref:hypothetical protein n=1 Tax=unclassified Microbacterium TaxID=2609290 RepID=UPI000869AC63|nr:MULTISPECIES: hypothetical protein [unclassified Microbacterium]MBN9213164.1 hypothetical protein [Microbacterium sp.]ODT40288.1 MAG: hypothetical protein ABS60_04745 [Microbacterium sp. SCN 71-17]ODU50691.1 MAG: hypothetical protein ABT07_03160 [Microbacterium sp. SCN 70-10]OJV78234.1 MAG: hypothetical protein BGO45_16395 [Microbacterium sp. 71-36]